MKFKLLFFILLLSASQLFAQTTYKSSGGKSKAKNQSGFKKDHVLVGGNLGFNFVNYNTYSYSYFLLNPIAGYRITDRYHAGLSFGYQWNRYRINNGLTTEKINTPLYYFSAWNRFFVFPQLFINAELQYSIYKYYLGPKIDPNTGNIVQVIEKANGPSILMGVGYSSTFGNNSYYAIWINYDILQDPKSLYYSENDFVAGLFYKAGLFISL